MNENKVLTGVKKNATIDVKTVKTTSAAMKLERSFHFQNAPMMSPSEKEEED
jgi:hypothetical protein